jgi:hypothetical protein
MAYYRVYFEGTGKEYGLVKSKGRPKIGKRTAFGKITQADEITRAEYSKGVDMVRREWKRKLGIFGKLMGA